MIPSPTPTVKTYTILLSQNAGTPQVQIQSAVVPNIDTAGRLIFGTPDDPVAAFEQGFWVACLESGAQVNPPATAPVPASSSTGLTGLFGSK